MRLTVSIIEAQSLTHSTLEPSQNTSMHLVFQEHYGACSTGASRA